MSPCGWKGRRALSQALNYNRAFLQVRQFGNTWKSELWPSSPFLLMGTRRLPTVDSPLQSCPALARGSMVVSTSEQDAFTLSARFQELSCPSSAYSGLLPRFCNETWVGLRAQGLASRLFLYRPLFLERERIRLTSQPFGDFACRGHPARSIF